MEVAVSFKQWAIVELMGHVKTAGFVQEAEMFGGKLMRIDVPQPNDQVVTQYFNASAIYRLTPCTEETARAVAVRSEPAPINQWDARAWLEPKAIQKNVDVPFSDEDEQDDDCAWCEGEGCETCSRI